ncbi:MAG: threonine ammonia-lyase [Actinomyces sp.]|nr:MAG: threonine ammonia-lyase [Actinomyces sp.]
MVTFADVEEAAGRIAGVVRRTPLTRTHGLDAVAGRPVWCKEENRQRTGSFKIRGALNRIARLPPSSRVVAASAGNHAQAVALAATTCGLPAVVHVPDNASLPKVEATRAYGAEVRFSGPTVDDCITAARAEAARTGAVYVAPFDDPGVIAGQGTIGLELLDQMAEAGVGPATVLVPVGGGGLVSGVAAALADSPHRVWGVEAAGCASMTASLAAGRPVTVSDVATIADGIAVKSPSALTLAHVEALVERVVTVDDEAIGRAIVVLLERAKSVVEPSGAVPLAAVLAGVVDVDGPVVCVQSGGNVDALLLVRLIEHGMTASGRYLRLEVVVPDRPGGLARATQALADEGLNIVGVEHHREGVDVAIGTVAVEFTVETRGPDHRDRALAALRTAGWQVTDLTGDC